MTFLLLETSLMYRFQHKAYTTKQIIRLIREARKVCRTLLSHLSAIRSGMLPHCSNNVIRFASKFEWKASWCNMDRTFSAEHLPSMVTQKKGEAAEEMSELGSIQNVRLNWRHIWNGEKMDELFIRCHIFGGRCSGIERSRVVEAGNTSKNWKRKKQEQWSGNNWTDSTSTLPPMYPFYA